MSKRARSESKKSCCWGLCLWGWFSKIAIIATVTAAAVLVVSLIVALVAAILPVLGYILAASFAYFILLREEFKGFRDTFRHKYCFLEIGRSFLCCTAHTLKKCCVCVSADGACCLPTCCCWKGSACGPTSCAPEKPPVKKPAAKKPQSPVKKAPAKKESAS